MERDDDRKACVAVVPWCGHPLCQLAALAEIVYGFWPEPGEWIGPLLVLIEMAVAGLVEEGKQAETSPAVYEAAFKAKLAADVRERYRIVGVVGTTGLLNKLENVKGAGLTMTPDEFQLLQSLLGRGRPS